MIDQLIDLAIQIQQIPAPTFEEKQRGEFVRDLFIEEKLTDVSMDAVGNVYARLPGRAAGQPLIISAHLDTVFPVGTSLQIRKEAGKVYGPGIGDNSLGVAAMFGILWALRQRRTGLNHDVWFVANVGEEGLGDLRGMRAVVERFGANVIGYLILEGLALGHVYHQGIGVQRYRIHFETAGGHSWSDFGSPSAVHELAALVTKLIAMEVPSMPRSTMNVGTISGGTGVNVVASDANCELDLRSESPIILNQLIEQAEGLIRSANRDGVRATFEIVGQRPAGQIPVDHPLIQLAVECSQSQGLTSTLTAGSTDANIPLSKGYPAVVLGITTGGGAHTTKEFMEIEPVGKGMEVLVKFVEEVGNGG